MSDNSRQMRLVINKTDPKPCLSPGVYLITDQGNDLVGRTCTALQGGVTTLQYRAKGKDPAESRIEGAALKKLCMNYGVTFIVNDDLRLACDLNADGVHLGQDDGSVAEARALLGTGKIIGRSTHNLQEALQAETDGADYIGFGAIYPTDSKHVTMIPGTTGLKEIRAHIKIPIVAIGGISIRNACRVIDAGADALAVISSIYAASRPDVAVMELKLLFNRSIPFPRGTVLSVAGSDSGGGAGIQADIKTITLLGSYAATVLTALTAQNTCGVSSIYGLPPSFITEQLNAVLSDIPVDVIKTGMLHTPLIIAELVEFLKEQPLTRPLVVDPVMIAKGGAALMECDATKFFCDQFLPLAYLLTPNVPEAERLLGRSIRSIEDMEDAARDIHRMGASNVLIKGGHLSGRQSCDVLFDGTECHRFSSERIFTNNTHGTGCSYASAIASFLAQGEPLFIAVQKAKHFISNAIRLSKPLGKGHGPINHYGAVHDTKKDTNHDAT